MLSSFIVLQGLEPYILNSVTWYKREYGSSLHKLMKTHYPEIRWSGRSSPNTMREVEETPPDGCVWKGLSRHSWLQFQSQSSTIQESAQTGDHSLLTLRWRRTACKLLQSCWEGEQTQEGRLSPRHPPAECRAGRIWMYRSRKFHHCHHLTGISHGQGSVSMDPAG